jgi:hypothetical protein
MALPLSPTKKLDNKNPYAAHQMNCKKPNQARFGELDHGQICPM